MKIEDFLDLAQSYSYLGWAVQEQLTAVIEGAALDDQNANALEMIGKFLRECDRAQVDGAGDFADQIKAHLAHQAAS